VSARELDGIRYAVHRTMDAWAHRGAARPAFESVWRETCQRQRYAGTPREREHVWRTWLAAGPPLTRAREIAVLEAAGPAAAQYLAARGIRNREPGSDDDSEDR
jgi:hypothetical protein